MLKRKDGKRLPIGFLPNGSANDTNVSFGVTNLDTALDYLTKGETIKMDI
jgi:diacylglycerol kinase family enzyme